MRIANVRAVATFFILLFLSFGGGVQAQERKSQSAPSLEEIDTSLGRSVLEELVDEKLSTDTAAFVATPAPDEECPVGTDRCYGKSGENFICCAKTMTCGSQNGNPVCKNPCGENASPCSVRSGTACCAKGTHCIVTPDPNGKKDKAECIANPTPPPSQGCADPNFPVPCGSRCCSANQQCIGDNMCAPKGDDCTFFPSGPSCCKPPSTPYPGKCCPPGTIFYPKFNDCWAIDAELCDGSVNPPVFCKPGTFCDSYTHQCRPRIS